MLTKNDTILSRNKQVNKQQKHRITLPVRRGFKHTHTLKERTMRAVRRGCTCTHTLKEGTKTAHVTKCTHRYSKRARLTCVVPDSV